MNIYRKIRRSNNETSKRFHQIVGYFSGTKIGDKIYIGWSHCDGTYETVVVEQKENKITTTKIYDIFRKKEGRDRADDRIILATSGIHNDAEKLPHLVLKNLDNFILQCKKCFRSDCDIVVY